MCGIFGILNNHQSSKEDINTAFKNGYKRGPEKSTFYEINKQTSFGFHRLAINGLNDESNQPIRADDCVLICNGEIYNYKELKAEELNDVSFKTQSDCETIIHLYRKYGIVETLKLINGEFAFALYDLKNETIMLARDPLGVRALYFAEATPFTKEIVFASELKCISPLNKHSVIKVEQFKPGCYMTIKQGIENMWYIDTRYSQYYSPLLPDVTAQIHESESSYLSMINTTLKQCVKRRVTTTERPVACLLSGGLDSSLITALVAKEYGGENLETYSIGMPGSEDLKYARMVAEHLRTKHTEIVMSEDEFFDAIPEVIKSIESYDTTTVRASTGNYLVSKYISKNSQAKVIFNGDGSDEVTGGYLYFHKAPSPDEFDKECRRLLKDIHTFDVLRSDKSISSNGLEPRTPFLDKEFVDMYMSIPLEFRYHAGRNQCEKYLLRKAFEAENLLPHEVLWRTKEAFSDGVSKATRSWYEVIEQKVSNMDLSYNSMHDTYTVNTPTTVEQFYFRSLFEMYYENLGYLIPYFWMPRFINAKDSSARTLDIYSNIINGSSKIKSIEQSSAF